MGFIETKKELKKRFLKAPYNFYFDELMDIYADAKDLDKRIDVIKLLIELQSQPGFVLFEELPKE